MLDPQLIKGLAANIAPGTDEPSIEAVSGKLTLSRAVVTAVAPTGVSVNLRGTVITNLPTYRGTEVGVGDVVELLFVGPNPRIIGVVQQQVSNRPALIKIDEKTLTSSGLITFSSIPQTFAALKVIGSVHIHDSSPLVVRTNNGVGAQSYDNTYYRADWNVATLARNSVFNENRAYISNLHADQHGQAVFTYFETTILEYSKIRSKFFRSDSWGGADDAAWMLSSISRLYETAAIHTLTFSEHDFTGLGAGTRIALYGVL